MNIIKVLNSNPETKTAIELCKKCSGDGWYYSIHDMYHDDKITCSVCAGTGRTTTIEMTVVCRVPHNYCEEVENGCT